jgi:subtilase family serine protease
MIGSKTILRLAAAIASVLAAGAFASLASASAKPALAHAHERAACRQHAVVRCAAHVVTDKHGRIVRFNAPPSNQAVQRLAQVGSTVYGPSALHTGYQLPWYSPVQQTIALVVTYHHPYAKYDIDRFNTQWGLGSFPSCSATVTTACFDQVNQNGYHSGYPVNTPSGSLWDLEASMDIEIAHAMCLNCKILLVEASPTVVDSAIAENKAARLGATEISNSWSITESQVSGTIWSYRSAFNHAGIAITASAGDHNYGVEFPADLNTVIAVGGTNLYLNSDSSYNRETVWGLSSSGGTGSGCSSFASDYTTAAWWQSAVRNWSSTLCGTRRGVSDVAADASCDTAVWIFTTATSTASSSWQLGCGTSLSSPIIAGVYALAGNAWTVSWPAQIPYQHTAYLHDVTTGSNGYCGTIMCNAVAGYDGPTGVGTPRGLGGF